MTDPISDRDLPVAVIGAGPVGLAAAAHLVQAGMRPLVFEAGDEVGGNIDSWAHVQVFSPWEMNLDERAVDLLQRHGWTSPDPAAYPTGRELITDYLGPLSQVPELSSHVRLSSRVMAVSRHGFDKLRSGDREDAPFELIVVTPDGVERHLARAVIDASGTVGTPNPLGAGGIPAIGEPDVGDRIAYGHPDVLGRERSRYAGRRVLVAGSGHSALGALIDLVELRREDPATEIVWAVRRPEVESLVAPRNDQLPERGRIALEVGAQLEQLEVVTGFAARSVADLGESLLVSDGEREIGPVDRVIAATGYRPDLHMLRELRLELDAWVEAPPALAPLIDPNVHSCGSVPPHGAYELKHDPEPGFYILGMKSYGRAPTFLMKTGYEQVRSVVAALAGDWEAAGRVELVLPETGVCSGPSGGDAEAACCAPPKAAEPVAVAEASGCCGPTPEPAAVSGASGGCCG